VKEVGAVEAQTTLNTLLDLAEGGEEIVITRQGREVARLVPPRRVVDPAASRAAAQRIRAMRQGVTLGGLDIKALINEGRR